MASRGVRAARPRIRGVVATLAVVALVALGAMGCGAAEDEPSVGDSPTAPGGDRATATAPPPPVPRSELEELGQRLLTETGATGGIVAVTSGGSAPVVVAVGAEATADGRPGAPIDRGAPLHVASVTKSYVAALALVLAADGVVELDAPVSTWVDWPGGDRITLRHLLTHTSGVGRFGDGESPSPFLALVAGGEAVDLDEVLVAARDVAPIGAPGGTTRYGNLNYVLAGAVLEAAADAPLAELLQTKLFVPLGMDGSAYPPTAPATPPPVGLFEVDQGLAPVATTAIPIDAWLTALGPAWGATSTIDDLLLWSDVVFRQRRAGEVDLSPMSAIGPGGYGLGVIGVGEDGDCVFDGCPPGARFDRWAVNGDFPGASTRVLHDPATDTTVIAFLNRNALDLDAALLDFLDRR